MYAPLERLGHQKQHRAPSTMDPQAMLGPSDKRVREGERSDKMILPHIPIQIAICQCLGDR